MQFSHPLHQAEAFDEFSALRDRAATSPPTYNELLQMCRNVRIAGCYSLLLQNDPRSFSTCLDVAAQAFLHFLPNVPEPMRVTSRALPFMDAIACGDIRCASQCAALLTSVWQPALEYEEDYLFVQFLFSYLSGSTGRRAAHNLVRTYEKAIDGSASHRFELVEALLTHDAAQFDAALRGLINDHIGYIKRMKAAGALPEGQVLSEGKVFIEGLALIRLAEADGMVVDEHYRLIPSGIRRDYSSGFTPQLWRTF